MELKKRMIDSGEYELIALNDKNQQFKIHWGGSDLYWTMMNYEEDNKFIVTREDKHLYSQLCDLFSIIEDNNSKYCRLLEENTFTWMSEARLPEESSSLTILKDEDSITIRFIRNPQDIYGKMANICAISFCLSGSRNEDVANAFSLMFLEYGDNLKEQKEKVKILK